MGFFLSLRTHLSTCFAPGHGYFPTACTSPRSVLELHGVACTFALHMHEALLRACEGALCGADDLAPLGVLVHVQLDCIMPDGRGRVEPACNELTCILHPFPLPAAHHSLVPHVAQAQDH